MPGTMSSRRDAHPPGLKGGKKDGSHISTTKWKNINRVYVDSEEDKEKEKIFWNAFSPQRTDGNGTSQSSQSQSSTLGDALNQISPSVVIGAINKRPVQPKRPKRSQTFVRHESKDELLKTYANASINKKKLQSKKQKPGISVSTEKSPVVPSTPTENNSSSDFPDDGMDDDLFEASQAIEQTFATQIKETPKRISTRCSTRNKLAEVPGTSKQNNERLTTTKAIKTSETLSEQFLRFNTKCGEDSNNQSTKFMEDKNVTTSYDCNTNKNVQDLLNTSAVMEGFLEDDDDDMLFSQLELP